MLNHHFLRRNILLYLCLLTVHTPEQANRAYAQGLLTGRADSSSAMPGIVARDDPLENDSRLNIRVTIKRPPIPVSEALERLAELTHVKMMAEDKEILYSRVSFRYKATPLKDI